MGHLWLSGTWFLFGLFRCAADASKDGSDTVPRVTEVTPKYGSINGATRLTIKGEGLVLFSHLFLCIFSRHGFIAFKDISLSCQLCKLEKPKQPTLHDNGQFEQHCRVPR